MKLMIIQTKNTKYILVDKGDGVFLISGHQRYCPEPRLIVLDRPPEVGGYIHGRFQDEGGGGLYTTQIQEIKEKEK